MKALFVGAVVAARKRGEGGNEAQILPYQVLNRNIERLDHARRKNERRVINVTQLSLSPASFAFAGYHPSHREPGIPYAAV